MQAVLAFAADQASRQDLLTALHLLASIRSASSACMFSCFLQNKPLTAPVNMYSHTNHLHAPLATDQQLQRLRQATTARKEAGSSEDEGEDPWTQELGYKPLAIPDSMFAKWTEASHQKPAAAAPAASSGGSSSRGPSARRASVATYIPGSSLQSVGGARGAAAAGGGAPAGWSSNGHARRASIGTVYPSDDASLAAKLSSTGAAAAVAAAGGGAGLPRRQSLSSDAPQLVRACCAAEQ